jgi:hypothetical protein
LQVLVSGRRSADPPSNSGEHGSVQMSAAFSECNGAEATMEPLKGSAKKKKKKKKKKADAPADALKATGIKRAFCHRILAWLIPDFDFMELFTASGVGAHRNPHDDF